MQMEDEDLLEYLVSEVKDYQLTHGSLLKLAAYEEDHTVPARYRYRCV